MKVWTWQTPSVRWTEKNTEDVIQPRLREIDRFFFVTRKRRLFTEECSLQTELRVVLRKWVRSWVTQTLQTSLVRFFRVRLTRGKRRSPKRMVEFLGAVRTRTSSALCVVTLFADDVFEKSLLELGTADECEDTVARRMGEVNSALETCGLRQNAVKLVILPNHRRTVENRKFSREKQECQIKPSHRFLGFVYPAMLSMGAEIYQRIWATNRGRELHGMWWHKRVPFKIKRTLFGGAVCGASLNCRDAWRKCSALSCSARPPGKDRTTQGLSALAKCGKGGG